MAFGYTYTLPSITGSHSNLVVLRKEADYPTEAIDGSVDAIDNGGGNERDYTDTNKVTQLSLDLPKLVSSGAPDVESWVKIPSASTGATIFTEADDVATSQPLVTEPFGRNSVWDDYQSVTHDGGVTDSKSSLVMIDDGSGAVTTSLWGSALTSARQRFDDFGIGDFTTNFTIQIWHNGTGSGTLLCKRDAGSRQWQLFIQSNAYNLATTGAATSPIIVAVPAGWNSVTIVFNSATDIDFYLNGSLVAAGLDRTSIATQATPTRIGYRGQGGLGSVAFAYDGDIGEARILSGTLSADFIATEYQNQVSAGPWGSVGAWIKQGADIQAIQNYYKRLRNG